MGRVFGGSVFLAVVTVGLAAWAQSPMTPARPNRADGGIGGLGGAAGEHQPAGRGCCRLR